MTEAENGESEGNNNNNDAQQSYSDEGRISWFRLCPIPRKNLVSHPIGIPEDTKTISA